MAHRPRSGMGEDFALVDGHGDPPLDPIGHQQAERVAERLAGEDIAAIYVTSLQRTVQTAAPLAARLGLEPIVERRPARGVSSVSGKAACSASTSPKGIRSRSR